MTNIADGNFAEETARAVTQHARDAHAHLAQIVAALKDQTKESGEGSGGGISGKHIQLAAQAHDLAAQLLQELDQ